MEKHVPDAHSASTSQLDDSSIELTTKFNGAALMDSGPLTKGSGPSNKSGNSPRDTQMDSGPLTKGSDPSDESDNAPPCHEAHSVWSVVSKSPGGRRRRFRLQPTSNVMSASSLRLSHRSSQVTFIITSLHTGCEGESQNQRIALLYLCT